MESNSNDNYVLVLENRTEVKDEKEVGISPLGQWDTSSPLLCPKPTVLPLIKPKTCLSAPIFLPATVRQICKDKEYISAPAALKQLSSSAISINILVVKSLSTDFG